jgi:hypothetical protein
MPVDPHGQILCRGIVADDVIEVLMVDRLVDPNLERRQVPIVANETRSSEIGGGGTQLQLHDIIMAMEARALMLLRQAGQLMTCREFEFFRDA